MVVASEAGWCGCGEMVFSWNMIENVGANCENVEMFIGFVAGEKRMKWFSLGHISGMRW